MPVGKYVLCLVLAGVAFAVLALVEEEDALFSRLGVHVAVPPGEPDEVHVAETAVRAFNGALEAAYREGELATLPDELLTPAVRAQLTGELEFQRRIGQGAPHTMTAFGIVRIEPTENEGWIVVSEEAWSTEGSAAPAGHVRFRYTLAPLGESLQVIEITPEAPGRSP